MCEEEHRLEQMLPHLCSEDSVLWLFEAQDGTEHFVLYGCWNIKEDGDNSM